MLSIEVKSDTIGPYLERLKARSTDLSQPLAEIGMALEALISGRFETETDPAGAPWAPWSESTRETYPDNGNGRILDRYGDMLASLNHQVDGDSVLVGFGQDYAVFHEFGTARMPRRGLIFEDPEAGTLTADDEQAVLDILERWLTPP